MTGRWQACKVNIWFYRGFVADQWPKGSNESHLCSLIGCPQGTGKTGKMAEKNPCQGKHREFGNLAKTQGKHREFGMLKL